MAVNKTIPDIKGRPITEGDVVILLTGEQDNRKYPVWGGNEGYVKGIVDEIHSGSKMVTIDWENGEDGIYDVSRNQFGRYDPSTAAQKHAAMAKAAQLAAKPNPGNVPKSAIDALLMQMMNDAIQNGMQPGKVYTDPNGNIHPGGSWDDDADKEAKKRLAEQMKNSHLDESHLEKLVMADEPKSEILSLLKQSRHAGLIFDDWGLGTTIEYGRGQSMLFWGPPGTGKTWAANCIAKATGRELLIINAANIQTSEPGGANRNIEQAFTTAREKNNVLFMDECDSLITTRADVGMILSSEINTLLTQIEKFEGICILATNRIDTLDEALERRIALIVEFPEPDYKGRRAIWSVLVPAKMPLGEGVSLDKLAEYALTGGQIKNVLLQAARLAAAAEAGKVELPHFDAAVKRVQKAKGLMGKNRNGAGSSGYKIVRG